MDLVLPIRPRHPGVRSPTLPWLRRANWP